MSSPGCIAGLVVDCGNGYCCPLGQTCVAYNGGEGCTVPDGPLTIPAAGAPTTSTSTQTTSRTISSTSASSTSASSTSASSTSASTTSAALTATPSSSTITSKSHSMAAGSIAGIAVGSTASFIALSLLVIWLFMRRARRRASPEIERAKYGEPFRESFEPVPVRYQSNTKPVPVRYRSSTKFDSDFMRGPPELNGSPVEKYGGSERGREREYPRGIPPAVLPAELRVGPPHRYPQTTVPGMAELPTS